MSQSPAVRTLPQLAREVWGGTGAWLGVLLCLIALVHQAIHLGILQKELSRRETGDCSLQMRKLCETPVCTRQKRDLPRGRKTRHDGNRPVLHLVPESLSWKAPEENTEISWKVSLQRGSSLEVQGKSVRVKHSGIYSIYSQVFYTDNIFTMGHLVLSRADGDSGKGEELLKCVQSMPKDKSLAYNTCYTSGVFSLQKDSTVTLVIARPNASVDTIKSATFLGFIKL